MRAHRSRFLGFLEFRDHEHRTNFFPSEAEIGLCFFPLGLYRKYVVEDCGLQDVIHGPEVRVFTLIHHQDLPVASPVFRYTSQIGPGAWQLGVALFKVVT